MQAFWKLYTCALFHQAQLDLNSNKSSACTLHATFDAPSRVAKIYSFYINTIWHATGDSRTETIAKQWLWALSWNIADSFTHTISVLSEWSIRKMSVILRYNSIYIYAFEEHANHDDRVLLCVLICVAFNFFLYYYPPFFCSSVVRREVAGFWNIWINTTFAIARQILRHFV